MDYVPFDYGEEINQWRVPTEEMPSEYDDPDFRLKQYYALIEKGSENMASNQSLNQRFDVHQQFIPAKQIYEYILKLLPPQDLFEFSLHNPPTSVDIILRAAQTYDPENYNLAVNLLKEDSIYNPALDDMVELMQLE